VIAPKLAAGGDGRIGPRAGLAIEGVREVPDDRKVPLLSLPATLIGDRDRVGVLRIHRPHDAREAISVAFQPCRTR
jgi:hypothetical protein